MNSYLSKVFSSLHLSKTSVWQLAVVFWVLTACLILVVQPLKHHAWNSIKNAGDNALAKRQYDLARVEYAKLHLIDLRSPDPARLVKRVNEAQQNILTLRSFYIERHDSKMLATLDKATATYTSPEESTHACQELLKAGESDLALLCIMQTTTSWPQYRDGWITESLIAKILGKNDLEASSFQKARQLDPSILPL